MLFEPTHRMFKPLMSIKQCYQNISVNSCVFKNKTFFILITCFYFDFKQLISRLQILAIEFH